MIAGKDFFIHILSSISCFDRNFAVPCKPFRIIIVQIASKSIATCTSENLYKNMINLKKTQNADGIIKLNLLSVVKHMWGFVSWIQHNVSGEEVKSFDQMRFGFYHIHYCAESFRFDLF